MKAFKIWTLLLIFIQIETVLNFKCGTNKLKIKPKRLNIKQNLKASSSLKAPAYTPLEMGFDFTTLQKPSSMSSSTFQNVKRILRETRSEFSKILQVQHYSIDLSGNLNDLMESCELTNIGEGYANFLKENDIIIFPMFDSSLGSQTLAAATPCALANNNRPIAGVVYINTNLNFDKTNINLYMKNILLHEITHVLVFHPTLWSLLYMSTTINGYSYINSTKAVEKAREHFNCNLIARIPLEDDGGQGSVGGHWEARYMLGDYMISTDFPDAAMSDITLGLFEDSGFYKVNYYSGGLFKFGKNKGCEFFQTACVNSNGVANFDEFCNTNGEAKCSSSRAIKTSCYKGGIVSANNCPVPFEYHSNTTYFQKHCNIGTASESLEKMGASSFCFMSSLSQENSVPLRPVCYEISCDTSNKKINVKVGSVTISCDNQIVSNPSGLQGSLECPKYSDLCASPTSSGKVYNDMYNIFTNEAADDGYTIPSSYDDFTGNALYEDDDDDTTITPVPRSGDYNIKINLILLAFGIILFLI